MNFSKIVLIVLGLQITSTACQTSLTAKRFDAPSTEGPLAWAELLQRFETGIYSFKNIDTNTSRAVERAILAMVGDERNWTKIEYLAKRFELYPSEESYLLSVKLKTHLALAQMEYGIAEKGLLKLIEKDPVDPRPKMALGILYLKGAQFAKAIPYFNDLKEDRRAVLGLIAAHRQLDDNDRVDALCEQYKEETADNWEISLNCALFEAQNLSSPQNARDQLQASLKLQPPESEGAMRLREAMTRIEASRRVTVEDAR
ncbi:MAG: hypothetical protein EOP10_27615 [Proteobacteria bacterium]|nr:MAG: hypothetical protein EOP10_27615 [Pseudomonadota bacterium]